MSLTSRLKRYAYPLKNLAPLGLHDALAAREDFARLLPDGVNPWRRVMSPRWRALLNSSRLAYVPEGALRDPECVVDVGAYVGTWSIAAIEFLSPRQVVCIEPTPWSFESLRVNLGGNPAVRLVPAAIGAAAGTATLHAMGHDVFNSLLSLRPGVGGYYGGVPERQAVTVDVRPLDDVLADVPRITLMKVDVQGAEMALMDGGREALLRTDTVLLEMNFVSHYEGDALFDDLHRRMTGEFGFRLFNMAPGKYGHDRRLLFVDAVYTRLP